MKGLEFINFVANDDLDVYMLLEDQLALKNFFAEKCPPVKKIQMNKLWTFGKDKSVLNDHAIKLLKQITNKTRLNSVKTNVNEHDIYEIPNDEIYQDQFLSAKLHWLLNDIKINGLAHPPQGYMQHDQYICHPGTYRYYSAFGQEIGHFEASVWDTNNSFPDVAPMEIEEWVEFCTKGFLRQNRSVVIEKDSVAESNRAITGNLRFLEIHEKDNHHDHCILNNNDALAEMYNYSKPVIYGPNNRILNKIQSYMPDPSIFSYCHLSAEIKNKFYIPYSMNFKGVGIYIDEKSEITNDISHLVLYLDTNDDVAVYRSKGITLFNNSTPNCKKLIPEIIEESTDQYLNKFLWASKISTIPSHIGNAL